MMINSDQSSEEASQLFIWKILEDYDLFTNCNYSLLKKIVADESI